MPEQLSTYLFTQGALGVGCLVLGWVCIKLYNKSERLEKEKSDILEAWRLDSKSSTAEMIKALNDNTNSVAMLSHKIEVAKGKK